MFEGGRIYTDTDIASDLTRVGWYSSVLVSVSLLSYHCVGVDDFMFPDDRRARPRMGPRSITSHCQPGTALTWSWKFGHTSGLHALSLTDVHPPPDLPLRTPGFHVNGSFRSIYTHAEAESPQPVYPHLSTANVTGRFQLEAATRLLRCLPFQPYERLDSHSLCPIHRLVSQLKIQVSDRSLESHVSSDFGWWCGAIVGLGFRSMDVGLPM